MGDINFLVFADKLMLMQFDQPKNNKFAVNMLLSQAAWILAVGVLFILCWVNEINLFVPLSLLISAWCFKVGLQYSKDGTTLERGYGSDFDSSNFENGQWVAVKGVLRPLVPGSDKDLPNTLAYHFRVFDLETSLGGSKGASSSGISKRAATRRFDGFYLLPTGISTSGGIVKLDGFPDLTALEKSAVPESIYTRGESSAEKGVLWLPSYLQRVRLIAAVAGQTDRVIKYGDRKREGTASGEYMSLENGDEVCVFGRWQDQVLVADKRRPRGLPVFKEPIEELTGELKADGKAFNAAGIFFLVISVSLVGWSYWSA